MSPQKKQLHLKTVFQANSSSNTSSHNNTSTSGEGSNDNINNFHVNQYYYHVQNLKQEETNLIESPSVPSSLTIVKSTAPKEVPPVTVASAAVDLVNRTNYMIPHQKTDRVVTVKNKSINSNSKNLQKLQLHEAQQKSKLKSEKKTNSKNLNVRTNSVDNSLINAMGEFNKSLPLAENVVNEANSLELSKANKLVNSTTQQISSLKLNRSTSSDKELSTQEAMRQPSRVSAKIQQLLNTLKVRIKRNWLRLLYILVHAPA